MDKIDWWRNRKVDWKKQYFDTWNHPHRSLIIQVLRSLSWSCLWEVGVGGGANLARILKDIKKPMQLGGSDVNADAIEFCKKTFNGGIFYCEKGNDMMMSDKSVDIVLCDMTLIYVTDIDSYLKEFRRVARNHVILVEFHSKIWWKRILARWRGYYVYNYQSLLAKHGFYNIYVFPMQKELWPGTDKNTEFRSLIVAQVP